MPDEATIADRDGELREALLRLAEHVSKLASAARKAIGQHFPVVEVQRPVLDDFQYSETGMHSQGWRSETEEKPYWYSLVSAVTDQLAQEGVYAEATRLLNVTAGAPADKPGGKVDVFVRTVANRLLEDPAEADRIIASTVDTALKELSGQDVPYKAAVQIAGLGLRDCDFQFRADNCEYRLRQVQREDVEVAEPVDSFRNPALLVDFPTGVLEIKHAGSGVMALQRRVAQANVLLRLYCPSRVRTLGWHVESPSVFDVMATAHFSSPESGRGIVSSIRPQEDVAGFWCAIAPALPVRFYWPDSGAPRPGPLDIAHDRYVWALGKGLPEERIATATMGLEALLCEGGDNLNYKLPMRTAKLLSYFGVSPERTRRVVRDAYKVRSAFVHGDTVTDKVKRRIDRDWGGHPQLGRTILDHLRLCIVCFIACGLESPKDKEHLVSMIDDALVGAMTGQLDEFVSRAQPRCVPRPMEE